MTDSLPTRPSREPRLLVVEGEAALRYALQRGELAVTRDQLYARLSAVLLPEMVFASPLTVRLALSEVLGEMEGAPEWLGALSARGGLAWVDFVSVASASVAEARRMSWLGAPAIQQSVAKDPRAALLFRAIGLVDVELARAGWVDPTVRDGAVTRVLGGALVETVVSTLGASSLLASGIASWSPSDLALWRALDAKLSLVGGAARIELPMFDRRLDAARPRDPLGRLIDAVAEAMDGAPETRPIEPVLGDFTLSDSLSPECRARVEVRRCDGVAGEARAVMDSAVAALEAGSRPEEIAIVVPEAGSLGSWIARALDQAGVPVHVCHAAKNARSGLLGCANDALLVAEQGLPRLGLAALLRSPYLDAERLTQWGEKTGARAALDLLARALEVTPTVSGVNPMDSLTNTVLAFVAGVQGRPGGESTPSAWPGGLPALVRRVAEPLARVGEARTLGEVLARVKQLFQDLGLSARPGPLLAAKLARDAPLEGIAKAELEAFARDATAAKRLAAALATLEEAARALECRTPARLAWLRLELDRELSSDSVSAEACAASAIRVGTLRDLSAAPLALLVFAGAGERSLEEESERSMFDAATIARLTEAIEPAMRGSVRALVGAGTVRLAAHADRAKRIVITYSTLDEEGGPSEPHPFVAWLVRQGVETSLWKNRILVEPPRTRHEERLADLAKGGADARALHPHAVERAAVEGRRESTFGLPARSFEGLTVPGELSSDALAILVEETGGGETPMSVTSLDRFSVCPFQGFASQVLRAHKTSTQREIVDPREEGTLLHGALAAAFSATQELWRDRPRDSGRIRMVARVAATRTLSLSPAGSLLRRVALDGIVENTMRVIEWSLADLEWDFFQAEARFGARLGSWDPVQLDDGRTRLRLRGSADRVDLAHEGGRLRVIDYKRGEESARRLTSELGETSFQLAIYSRAAALSLGVDAMQGVYLPTRRLTPSFASKDPSGAWARAHAVEEDRPRFERRALSIVEQVRGGDVEPRPSNPEACRVCDFDGVCRKPRFVIVSALEDGQEETRDGA